jgi:hypothetical protein
MKSIRAAVYMTIALHFLRKTASKLLSATPKYTFDGNVIHVPHSYSGPSKPMYVSVVRPTPPGPLPIVVCANYCIAAAVRAFINEKLPDVPVCTGYPKAEPSPKFQEFLKKQRIFPLTGNINALDNHNEIYETLAFVQLKEN